MDIFGAVLFMFLPYAAGYSCKRILRWRETNQIETYLIGFFFLFFLQGVILIPCVWLEKSLVTAANILLIVALFLVVLAVILGICEFVKNRKNTSEETRVKAFWKRTERVLLVLMCAVFACILVRMFLGLDILREDIMLETVMTTVQSDSLFKVHPLTGRIMEGGMIASKKIVTLPLFYAGVVQLTGLEAGVFLYLEVGAMVLLCSYYAVALLFSKITMPTRGKMYVFWIVYGLMILAGDYHADTLSYRLMYNGYDGMTVCFAVILPYLLYRIVSWYKMESGEEAVTMGSRIMHITKIALGFATSIVITGLGTGFLFLFMAGVIAGICCLLKSIKEVRACRE